MENQNIEIIDNSTNIEYTPVKEHTGIDISCPSCGSIIGNIEDESTDLSQTTTESFKCPHCEANCLIPKGMKLIENLEGE